MPALAPSERAQWGAVGRVNQAGFRKLSACTGTLIAPDLVLTAAHCVFRASKGRSLVHFVAGWNRGEKHAHRTVDEITMHPLYRDDGRTISLAHDLAVLRLESPVSPEVVVPLPLLKRPSPTAQADLMLGYHNRRPHVLNGRRDCTLSKTDPRGLVIYDCMVISGNSGGPVLEERVTGWAITAVIVAQGNAPEGAIAVPVDNWLLRQWHKAQKRALDQP